MKIRSAIAELLDANRLTDEQTDMTKLIDPYRNFANASKNEIGRDYSGNFPYKPPTVEKVRSSHSVAADLLFSDIWHVRTSPMWRRNVLLHLWSLSLKKKAVYSAETLKTTYLAALRYYDNEKDETQKYN